MHRWSDEEINARLYGGYYGGENSMDTRQYDTMVNDIKERIGYEESIEEGYNLFEDVITGGADAGWSGFIYTTETVEFFDAYEETIIEMLQDEADNFGYSNVAEFVASFNRAEMADTMDGYKNLLAWYALEEVARREVEDV